MAERTVIDRGPVNNIDAPSAGMFAITPSDVTDGTGDFVDGTAVKHYARFIYVTTAGTVKVVFQDGSTFTFTAANGTLLPNAAVGGSWPSFIKRVFSTGTTATGLYGIK